MELKENLMRFSISFLSAQEHLLMHLLHKISNLLDATFQICMPVQVRHNLRTANTINCAICITGLSFIIFIGQCAPLIAFLISAGESITEIIEHWTDELIFPSPLRLEIKGV